MNYPLKKIYITQVWGVNGDVYKRFGYRGHNGIDYRLFDEQGNKSDKAKLYAPHGGRIIEAGFDADGYGKYLKIENLIEGSVLAHLDSYSVKVGDVVKEGQEIGVCGNTGWSTGPHLHWGYYRFPRNKQNGYGGTIDQTPYIGKEIIIKESMSELLNYLGMQDEKSAISRLKEHLGGNIKCEWGDEKENLGGHLGSARRDINQRKETLSKATLYVSEIEELLKITQGSSDIAERLQAILQKATVLKRENDTLSDSVDVEVRPDQEAETQFPMLEALALEIYQLVRSK